MFMALPNFPVLFLLPKCGCHVISQPLALATTFHTAVIPSPSYGMTPSDCNLTQNLISLHCFRSGIWLQQEKEHESWIYKNRE